MPGRCLPVLRGSGTSLVTGLQGAPPAPVFSGTGDSAQITFPDAAAVEGCGLTGPVPASSRTPPGLLRQTARWDSCFLLC